MIGIIGAMEEEVAALKEDMDIQETVEQASMVFCKGKLCGKDVVEAESAKSMLASVPRYLWTGSRQIC